MSNIRCAPNEPGYADRPEPVRQSNARLRKASDTIITFLNDKLKPMRQESHAAFLLRKVEFIESAASAVVVTVPDEVNAFRIFETLNDRGLKASQADILKNYFFSRAGERLPAFCELVCTIFDFWWSRRNARPAIFFSYARSRE